MANKLYEESYIEEIADAIREKTGKSEKMKLSQMAGEIREIGAGKNENSNTISKFSTIETINLKNKTFVNSALIIE